MPQNFARGAEKPVMLPLTGWTCLWGDIIDTRTKDRPVGHGFCVPIQSSGVTDKFSDWKSVWDLLLDLTCPLYPV